MINGINSNLAKLWPSLNNKSANKAQGVNFADSAAANPANSQGISLKLDGSALVSGGKQLPGGGWMNASVYKADSYSIDNPVFLVKGTNVDGTSFEVEVNINDVNPRDASFVEMFALDGYYAANGQPLSVARAAAWALSGPPGLNDAFTRFDFFPPLQEMMETQRFHGNFNGYLRYKHIVSSLLDFIERK